MIPILRSSSALAAALLLAGGAPLGAQEEKPGAAVAAGEGTSPGNELAELRKAVDTLSLKIDGLTRELSELRRKVGSTGDAETKPAPAPPAAAETLPVPKEPLPPQPEVRAAEATGGGVKHIVAKGETLTSIAKQYNIPVAALQSANKIQDGRKLQIGQILTIPAPAETSPDKKEKP
jgi:LysM repeat protein